MSTFAKGWVICSADSSWLKKVPFPVSFFLAQTGIWNPDDSIDFDNVKISSNLILFGIFTALIIHFAFAITIDNFGEKYTKKYLTELVKAEK